MSKDEADMAAGPCPQNVPRRTLADISNLPQKHRQVDPSQCVPGTTKEYVQQLLKDNLALANILAQKNQIIAQRGTELERLRANLIKEQEHNRQLALSHTQMLVDLNTGKDRLKALHHELGCKNGLLKASKSELEEHVSMGQCQPADAKLLEEGEFSKESRGDDKKPHTTKRKPRSCSLGSAESFQSEFNAGNKRPSTRRQSAQFKAVESKHALNPCETDDAKFPECPMATESLPENGSTSVNVEVKNEDNDNGSNCSLKWESQEFGRLSLCRPSRRASRKVQSYKEIPLNVKMRRSE